MSVMATRSSFLASSGEVLPDGRAACGVCIFTGVESRVGCNLPGERGGGDPAPFRVPPVGSMIHAFGGGVLRPPDRAAAPAEGEDPACETWPEECPNGSLDDGARRSGAPEVVCTAAPAAGLAGFTRGSEGRAAGCGSVRLEPVAAGRGGGAVFVGPRPDSDVGASCMLRSRSTKDALADGGRSVDSGRRAGTAAAPTLPLPRNPLLNMVCRVADEGSAGCAAGPVGIHGAPAARRSKRCRKC